MSADTTVVIACVPNHGMFGEMEYTADVVQAVENLTTDNPWQLEAARGIFLNGHHPWFINLGLAKQYANLLAQNARIQGFLEYEDRPIIEIADDGVHLLSKKGKRLT